MVADPLKTAVVLLIFNRPAQTRQVFEQIRRARPAKLLVVADGPRRDRPRDAGLCTATREIVRDVDWPCEVLTRFAEENLGCRANVSLGLDWAFQQVDEAIVLEDDCLPEATFFPFCEELLARYRDDLRISQICGSNYQQGLRRTEFSYYFSRHAHIWGWATWRRSWSHRDLAMTRWAELRNTSWLRDYVGNAKAAFYWKKLFDDAHAARADSLNSWAIPWTFSNWTRGSLSIIPETNLVRNIGHTAEGTHTTGSGAANQTEATSMQFPLRHPPTIEPHAEADLYTEETFYYGQTLPERLFWKLRLPISVATVRKFRRLASGLKR